MSRHRFKIRLMRGAAVLPILFGGSALAASPTAYDWSGFYAGLTAGAAWSRSDETTNIPCSEPINLGYFCAVGSPGQGSTISAAMTGAYSKTGFTGGAETGYNWQSGATVYGIEVDLQSFKGASRSTTFIGTGPNFLVVGAPISLSSTTDADWLFTARGRIGYTFDSLLLYGTGGLALTRLSTNFNYRDLNSFTGYGNWTQSENKVGWAAGAGVEWRLSKTWSVKAEYLYVSFGSITASGNIVTTTPVAYSNAISTSADLTAQIARLGVNYKF